ncbi:uncharacterized protein LOC114533451 [Dendronephthya gigantea]|nr:uncharacterized protein LOC114533451 [Dendronephthya gigantea]
MEAITINCQLYKIYGWVKREETAAIKLKDNNGEVPLRNEYTGEILNLIKDSDTPTPIKNGFVQPFSVDLHEIYEGRCPDSPPVFKLSKSDKQRNLNVFQLVVQLEFIDGSRSQKFTSPKFNLRTLTETETNPMPPDSVSGPSPGKKTKYDVEIDGSVNGQGSPGESVADSGIFDDGSVRHYRQILVDTLDAKTANVDKVVAKDVRVNGNFNVETGRADLAYHLTLRDPDNYDDLKEGDIVGFYKSESGETYIQRLRSDNVHNALHAGVISRSHWLAGHKPANPVIKTDTVCVIGIVNVKVVGSIENGERIYASTDNPGKAIPQTYMPAGSFLRKKHVLLGMALESKKSTKMLDDTHLVKCFVCIVLDVSRRELLEEIEDMYGWYEKSTEEQIKIANKKTWGRLKGYALSTVLALGLIICLIYQWLVPGSMFRYWLCRRGSIPDHILYYSYVDVNQLRSYNVHGIEFTWEKLQDKVGFKFKKNTRAEEPIRYYLNLDRCAYYWADGASGNNIGGRKYVGGSRILSVGKNCKKVYELYEQTHQWMDVKNQSSVRCTPNSNAGLLLK